MSYTCKNLYDVQFTNSDSTTILRVHHNKYETIVSNISNYDSIIFQYDIDLHDDIDLKKIILDQQLIFDFKENHKLLYTTLNNIQYHKRGENKISNDILFKHTNPKDPKCSRGIYITYDSKKITTGIIDDKNNSSTFELKDNKSGRITWTISCIIESLKIIFVGSVYIHVSNGTLFVDNITFRFSDIIQKIEAC